MHYLDRNKIFLLKNQTIQSYHMPIKCSDAQPLVEYEKKTAL